MIEYITKEEVKSICIDGVPIVWVMKDIADLIVDKTNEALRSLEEERKNLVRVGRSW